MATANASPTWFLNIPTGNNPHHLVRERMMRETARVVKAIICI